VCSRAASEDDDSDAGSVSRGTAFSVEYVLQWDERAQAKKKTDDELQRGDETAGRDQTSDSMRIINAAGRRLERCVLGAFVLAGCHMHQQGSPAIVIRKRGLGVP
jgi:hypothetical protein